jgi:hypothetical protein
MGGAKPSKFPTKLSNFRQPPPFALEKAVFSPLIGQNFQKFVIFHEGGGGGLSPRPIKISATAPHKGLSLETTESSTYIFRLASNGFCY